MDDRLKEHGMFSWNELKTDDVEAAKAFYAKVFGWTLEDVPMPDMTYTLLKLDDREVGGMMKLPAEAGGAPPHWGVYVSVDDVDAVARTAEKLGGKVLVQPRDLPFIGRVCVIQDPQGAVISAIKYVAGA